MMASRSQNLQVCTWILLFFVLAEVRVQAGPIIQHSTRLAREVYPEIDPASPIALENDGNNQAQVCIVGDVVYGIDELVPAEQPCLKCRCQPPGVLCETIKCAKKQGCKAIHRPNKCCPDYQCECHHEGRVYANGERLKTLPGGECKVCYCRGGELQCAQVSCYVRSDCQAKTVPGQCCPKYDHCPPKEPLLGRPTNSTETDVNRQTLELYPLTTLLQNSSEQDNSNKIDKAEQVTTVLDDLLKITRSTQTLDFTENVRKQIEQPKITIQEIIPEVREIPITTPVAKLEQELFESANDLVTDAEPDSSEISEVFQHPPPVLRIGDKLLFLKQGELVPEKDASTPSSVITIIGAEGLQRGFEDSGEFHEFKTNESFNSNDLELKTSESSHILSLVKRKNKPEETSQSTDNVLETTPGSTEAPTTQEPSFSSSLSSISSETERETSTVSLEKSSTPLLPETPEENPAYPALPDVMGTETAKILPEVLEVRNNNTLALNSSNNEWLKSTEDSESLINVKAILPEEVLQARAPSDSDFEETSTSAFSSESVEDIGSTTELPESSTSWVELVEETTLDSGEATTLHINSSSSLTLDEENASVDQSASSELEDMTKTESTTELPRKFDDVEVVNKNTSTFSAKEQEDNQESAINLKKEEVELINLNETKSTEESPGKKIEKRENSPEDEAEEVFRQLDSELSADNGETPFQTEEEEKAESNRIFQELLEETSTPKPARKYKDKDAETLERVSDAIAKLTLKGKQGGRFDASIIGVITDFFGGQYRQH